MIQRGLKILSYILFFILIFTTTSYAKLTRLGQMTFIATLELQASSPTNLEGFLVIGNPDDAEYQRAILRLKVPKGIAYKLVTDEDNNKVIFFQGSISGYQTISAIWIIYQGYKGSSVDKPRDKYLKPEPGLNYNSSALKGILSKIPDREPNESDSEYLKRIMTPLRVTLASYRYGRRARSVERLIQTGEGVCEDFAALATAILRAKGIKARVVNGYALWGLDLSSKRALKDLQNSRSAHSWVEVFIDDRWQTLDITPSLSGGFRGLVQPGREGYNYLKLVNGYGKFFLNRVKYEGSLRINFKFNLIYTPYRYSR